MEPTNWQEILPMLKPGEVLWLVAKTGSAGLELVDKILAADGRSLELEGFILKKLSRIQKAKVWTGDRGFRVRVRAGSDQDRTALAKVLYAGVVRIY